MGMTRALRAIRCTSAALAAFAFVAGSDADAWNGKGHMTVAAAAWKDMSPQARAKASALLRLNPDYPSWVRNVAPADGDLVAFVKAATWPDQIRSTYQDDGSSPAGRPTDARNIGYADCLKHRYWHFKDIPFSTDGTPLEDAKEPNALTQIRAFSAALANPATIDEVKSYDLAWLLHLVGDVHQPLHATSRFTQQSKHGDSGGNSVTLCVRGHSCSTRFNSMHAYWDDALGNSAAASSALKLACIQAAPGAHCLPAAQVAAASIGDPGAWLLESFQLARTVAYKRPVGAGKGPYYVTARYQAAVATTAERQVALAGARLARLLDAALAAGVAGPVMAPPVASATICPRVQ
jgi:hypothetical protein